MITLDSTGFCKDFIKEIGGSYLDEDNILYKHTDNNIVGKRCVSSKGGFRYCWLEDVPKDEMVHKYLHGKEANYNETF